MPGDVLDLSAGVLSVGAEEVVTASACTCPSFTAAHPELYALAPGRPSPAAAWLHGTSV
ncbi:hypothetical protein ACFWRV_20365 [Streptomyces sp. NPDC058576]|uniref:hypothetical protein n=1 Tax=Streptomyces sp. NPDC058576 TaxID=3346547 RepID=UPI003652292B